MSIDKISSRLREHPIFLPWGRKIILEEIVAICDPVVAKFI